MFQRLVGVGRRFLKYLTSSLAKRRIRRHRRLMLLEPLAARQVLASYTVPTADSATLNIATSGESLSITADSSDYIITSAGGSGWSGSAATGVTVSGNDLRLAKATFTGTITINDQSGISGGAVTFNSNTGTTYGANFTVTLNDAPGAVTFGTGANPSFGAKNLGISTTGNVVFNSSATVAATTGNVSISAGGTLTLGSSTGISTTQGSLTLASTGATSLAMSAAVSTTSGALVVSAGGAITLASSASVAATGGGNVTLNSTGSSVTATVDSTADVSGTTVAISAASGISLNTAATNASLTVTSAGSINVSDTAGGLTVTSASTSNGGITLSAASGALVLTSVTAGSNSVTASTSVSGDIQVGSVTAGTSVTLTSVGAITESGSDSLADLSGTSISLSADSGIGTSSEALEINATTGLTAAVGSAGIINVGDTSGGLTVTSATTTSGAITLSATSGDLTLASVTAIGGNITASTVTSGTIAIGSVSASGNSASFTSAAAINESGTDGTADIVADTINLTATSGIGVSGALEIDAHATTGGLTAVAGASGVINIADTTGGLLVTSATTLAGSITLTAASGNLTLTSVSATGGAISASTTISGSILVDSVTAANSTVGLTAIGTIEEDGAGDSAADVTGTALTLQAGTGIGVNTGGALEINAEVGGAAGTLSATVSGTGDLSVMDTAGGLTVTTASTSVGAVSLEAVGGNLTVLSASAGGSSYDMTLTTTTSGNITLTNLSNPGDLVTVNSAGGIIDSADSLTDISAGGVVLIATTGIGVGGSLTDKELEIAATNLDIENATSGGVQVNRTGGSLTVTDLDGSGGAHTLAGGGYIVATNALTISMSLALNENFTLTASNSSSANDDLTIDNNAEVTLTNAANRTLTLQAGDDLVLGTGGKVITDGGGSHTVTIDIDREGASFADSDRGSVTQDSGTDTRVTAATLTVTAPDGVGSLAQPVYIAAGVLTVTSVGNNGTQYWVEEDGLTEFSLLAGTGSVNLVATTGNLLSADSAVDIVAATAAVILDGGSFGDTDVAAGNAIETTVADLTVDASVGNGDIFVRETDGLTALSLHAGSGSILLHAAAGSVADTDSDMDVTTTGGFGFSSSAGSLGTSSNFINTEVANLEVNVVGAVYISNSIGLILGDVDPALTGVLTGIDATGVIDIRSVGAMSVNENVTTTTGALSLQAGESAADDTTDILAISDSITVSTGSGAITLGGGDAVTAGASSVITATTSVTVNVDNAAGALGADNDTSDGGLVDFDTSVPDPAITAPSGLVVTGGANEDGFELKPLTSGTLTVNGGGPVLPTGSDHLTLDLSDVAVGNATVLLGSAAASGTMTFGTSETEKTVTFDSVEEVSATPTTNPYHLVLDMTYSGFSDAVADTIAVERADGASSATTDDLLEIEINGTGSPFFSGVQSGILSLTVIGSTDDDLFQITETSYGLPELATVSPAVGAVLVNNTGLSPAGGASAGSHLLTSLQPYLAGFSDTALTDWDRTDVSIHFDGGSSPDEDQIQVVLATAHTALVVGNSTQGNLLTDKWAADDLMGDAGTGALDLLVSFANLTSDEPVKWSGAGGMLIANAAGTTATTEIIVSDYDLTSDDGVNFVEGNESFLEQTVSGFEWLYVLGGDNSETISLASLDTADPDSSGPGKPVAFVTLDGDNMPTIAKLLTSTLYSSSSNTLGTDTANDTLMVETLPADVTVALLGGIGNDAFLIYNDLDTASIEDDSVEGFEGSLIVSPAALIYSDQVGLDEAATDDALVIRDFGDTGGGDSISIVSSNDLGATPVYTAIDGLFDGATAPDQIIYSQIESLTIELGAGDDLVDFDFQGMSDELETVVVSGNDGDDEFTFLSDTPYGADQVTPPEDADIPVLTIMGEDGNDQFIFMDSAELFGIGTCIDGGYGEDLLDFSNFFNERAVYLVTIGSKDGYQGYEGDWGIAKGGGQLGAGELAPMREQGDYPCFTNIDVLEGSPTPYDVLYGADRDTYWNLNGYGDDTLDAGIVMDGIPLSIDAECQCGGYVGQDLAFTSVENLYGGGLRDWMDIGPSFQLTGAIGGGDHGAVSDTLDMRDRTDDLSVDLTLLTASFAGGIDVAPDISPTSQTLGKLRPRIEEGGDAGASIENLLGGSGNDTLIGDVDVNWIAGNDGDDTLNGKDGVDSVDGGWGNDVLQVEGAEAINDVSLGGTGESLDPLDEDLMINIGSGTVTLSTFNNSSTDFTNSIDEYDGAGMGLVIISSGGRMHLGSTLLTNTPTVSGGAGNDSVTVSYENGVATAYSAGAGTNDALTITFEATDIQSMVALMTLDDIVAIQAFIAAPTAGPLELTSDSTKGNFTVSNDFESVRIAVYDSGQIVDITTCFRQISLITQIQFGTDSDESLTGTSANDLIFGLDGVDLISGLDGVDCIFGGGGNDSVLGGENTDTIAGGEGDDILDGEAAADRILGGLGDDILEGNFGDDVIYGNAGADVLEGGGDSDMMYGGAGDDSLDGQAGNDSLWGQAGDDTLMGSEGDDVLNGGRDSGTTANHDTVDGGVGNDNIQTQGCESEYDAIQGGAGSNSITNIDMDGSPSDLVFNEFLGQEINIRDIYGNGARITGNNDANLLDFRITATASEFVRMSAVPAIDGCAGDDEIHGTLGADTIFGSSDNDVIYGYNLGDRIDGGSGSDMIYGGPDSDTIFGGTENDVLRGETGNDSIYGGSGNDSLLGLEGNDILDGQLDIDNVDGGVGNDIFPIRSDEAEYDVFNGGLGSDRLINMGGSSLVLNGFNGPGNALEEFVASFAAILGNSNGNTFDFRYGTTTSFVQLFNVTFVSGEGGNDTIRGSDIAETLLGGDGNDIIYGNGGADSLDGGGGGDSLYGGNDGDTIFGSTGDDYIDGGTGNDTMSGGVGNDRLEGGEGNDVLNGNVGTDSISGGGGEDEIRTQSGESYDDTLSGGIGKDRLVNILSGAALVFQNFDGPNRGIESIFGGNAPFIGDGTSNNFDFRLSTSTTASFVALNNVTQIDMGNGDDVVHGTAGNDTIFGRGGIDVINSWGGNDTIYGGVGNDIIRGGVGNDRIEGGDGADSLMGEVGADLILGQGGVDTIAGGDGDDTLDGADGLSGGVVGDSIDGGAGNDNILVRGSEAEFDTIRGGAGTDRLTNTQVGVNLVMDSFVALTSQVELLFASNSRLVGNSGNNTIDLRLTATGASSLTVTGLLGIDGLDGNDTIYGTKGPDSITGGAGMDSIYGYDGSDSLAGGDGDDSIDGGAGNDTIFGEAGGDILLGGAGNDSLVGALGVDQLTGGAGNDTFRFDSTAGDSTQIDVMSDLAATDIVRFVGYTFTTGVASYAKLNLSAPSTTNAVLHLTNTGTAVNGTTIKQISTPNLKTKPTSSKVLFI